MHVRDRKVRVDRTLVVEHTLDGCKITERGLAPLIAQTVRYW